MVGDRPISSYDELLSMAVQTASWMMLLMADLMLLNASSVRHCWMLGPNRPIRDRRRSGRSVAELMAGMFWQMASHGELLRNQFAMLANW